MHPHHLVLTLATLYTLVSSNTCQCGFSTTGSHTEVFTDFLETDFTANTVDGWIPQDYNVTQKEARGPFGKQAHPENVIPSSQGLQLWVHPPHDDNKTVPMAEVASSRTDMIYGTFRIRAKLSSVNGTCGAFFWFWNNTQEIDMEFLSKQLTQPHSAPVNLVIQSKASEAAGWDASKTPGFDVHSLPFRPDADFHEYRFDWLPGKVSFYADNVLLKTMTQDIPNSPGHVVLNHWSNGDWAWSAGPPTTSAAMIVSHAGMYFNSSDVNMRAYHKKECPKRDASKICTINSDIRQALMLPQGGTSDDSSSLKGNFTAAGPSEQAKKAAKKGSFGFIITGAVVGLFIVLFIAAMITVRHWGTWRDKLSRVCGLKSHHKGVSSESSSHSMEMQQK